MGTLLLALYIALAVLALGQSLALVIQTWEHRRYTRSCMRDLGGPRATGRAAVFAPCKGIDVSLEENLRSLLRQDYGDYEVTFIVESVDDPACEVIRRVMAQNPDVPTRLVVAGRADHSGQKVHNLRAATARLSPEIEYLAFVDSDVSPRPEWLRMLVGRMCQCGLGAVTGYRWFIPSRESPANCLLYSLNCGVMSLLGRDSRHLIWGGSWGISRDVFDSIGLHAAWQGTLSDDLVAGRTLRRAKYPARFEPASVMASPLDVSLRGAFSFVRRQYLVGKFYTPAWWWFGVVALSFSALTWLGTTAALVASIAAGSPPLWLSAGVLLTLYGLSVVRGVIRQKVLWIHFPNRARRLRKARHFDVWLSPAVTVLHWLAVLSSLYGCHITWRGICYRVFPGGRIRMLSRDGLPATSPDDQPAEQATTVSLDRPKAYRKAG